MPIRRSLIAAASLTVVLSSVTFFMLRAPHGVKVPRGNAPEPEQAQIQPALPADTCSARRRDLMGLPALPGNPQFNGARAEILARAKSEPVVFLSTPEPPIADSAITRLRQRLYEESYPWRAFAELLRQYRKHPKVLRQVLLTEGYLYADRPTVAALLANNVYLNHLFDEPTLTVIRGNRTLTAERKGTEYFFADGPEQGQLARLWLFDRVAPRGVTLGPSRLVSARELGEATGASEIEIERLTVDGVVATLVYPGVRVPAVLALKQDALQMDCEVPVLATDRVKLQAARLLARRRGAVLAHLREAIDEEIVEALPFDEPKTEEGQQDGKLRQEWKSAYRKGLYSYEFNGDKYSVFGQKGIARVPQVCVDFVVDSWERMAGTRWLGLHEGRGRQVGRIDFDKLDIENRRSVDRLIEFARARPEWFDVLEFSESERVKFQDRQRFFNRLYEQRADFQPGDVVAILGPRSDEKLHYHSFFIVAADPISGMPTQVAANAGRPRIRSWEAEMQNAPRRGILARLRPRLAWLEQLAGIDGRSPIDLGPTRGGIASRAPEL